MTWKVPALMLGATDPVWLQMGVILLATLVSEDLTCIAVGLLVRAGQLDWLVGVAGCLVGIFVGDVGLWLLGRGSAIGLLRVVPAVFRPRSAKQSRADLLSWLDRRGGWALLAARFLPGTRLPLYLAAGALGGNFRRFLGWTALGCLLQPPLLVATTVILGESVIGPFSWVIGPGWPALLLAAIVLFVGLQILLLASTSGGRGKLAARLSRLWRAEFWPVQVFYVPLVPWLGWLALRHRGVLAWTAANPGIPHGGVVGESKFALLEKLPADSVVPGFLVPPEEPSLRLELVKKTIEEKGWSFPLILKPDAGQRGAGVKRFLDLSGVDKYLVDQPESVIVQPWHPGPYEVGIFYYRFPGEEKGRIFSITDKVFPILTGDGCSTLEELIWKHPRYRMQARVFLARHEADRQRILAFGERMTLALAGNHCQGTQFLDGSHLITPALENAIDSIARRMPGFYIGRFDVRYSRREDLAAGRNLGIVEVNGATSESTNIYDPSWSLFSTYRTLFRQWRLLYQIGAANQRLGHEATSIPDLLHLVWSHYRQRRVNLLAD